MKDHQLSRPATPSLQAAQSLLQPSNSNIMRSFLLILLALVTSSTTTAVAVPATEGPPPIPDFPDGYFAGYNNLDGTSTLQFLDTNENFTFTPKPQPASAELEKRQEEGHILRLISCWVGSLDRAGLDGGMNEMRSRLSHTPIGVGQFSDWPDYFGYNNRGVYTYVCENSGQDGARFSFDTALLNDFSYRMDQECGGYVPGFVRTRESYQVQARLLFGRTLSGTKVCQGNWRAT